MKSGYVLSALSAMILLFVQATSPAHAQDDFVSTCKQAIQSDLLRVTTEADLEIACQCAATETKSAKVKPEIMARVFAKDEQKNIFETNIYLLYEIFLSGADNGHQSFLHFTVSEDDAKRSDRLFNRLKSCFGRISAVGIFERRSQTYDVQRSLKAAGFATDLVKGEGQTPSFLFGRLIGNRVVQLERFVEYAADYNTKPKGDGWPKQPGFAWSKSLAAELGNPFVLVCKYSAGLMNDGVTWEEGDWTAYLITPKSDSAQCPIKP